MAFRLPTFNLTCSIWRTGWAASNYATPDVQAICNLSPGRRVGLVRLAGVNSPVGYVMMELLLPPLTDVRPAIGANGTEDLVEVPAGSNMFYEVQAVCDVAKGFANEYRMAFLVFTGGTQTFADTGPIPVPVPLP